MATPDPSPSSTHQSTARGRPRSVTRPAAATKTIAEATSKPRCNAPPILLSSSVLTVNVPRMEARMPTPANNTGNRTSDRWSESKLDSSIPHSATAAGAPSAHASAIDEIMLPTYDSNRSAPIPATSPTLSPTLSAIVAGFRGSSSGIPASTLPERSPATSAAFV